MYLKGFLINRGYKEDLADSQCSRVTEVRRSELSCKNQKRGRDEKERLVLVVNYHPALLRIHRILRELHVLVEWSPLLKSILPKPPIVSFRQPRNFKDFLVRAKLESEIQFDKGMFGCGKVRCRISKFVETGTIFKSTVEKKSFHINHSFDCDSSGVVYLITCKRCGKQYVGNTITEYRKRFNNHKSSINGYGKGQRNICGEHLSAHFFEEGHLGLEDWEVQIIDVTDKRDTKNRESIWAEKINGFVPLGLNVRDL